MSSFQAQSQWDNNSDSIIHNSENHSPSFKGIRISKKALAIISAAFIIMIASFCLYYFTARSIDGLWIRQMDDYNELAGMVVEVKNGKGTIVAMPDSADAFFVGQVKWFGIKKTGFGKYEWYSLHHYEDEDKYGYADYLTYVIVSPDGTTLSSSSESVNKGKYQLWKRIKEIP